MARRPLVALALVVIIVLAGCTGFLPGGGDGSVPGAENGTQNGDEYDSAEPPREPPTLSENASVRDAGTVNDAFVDADENLSDSNLPEYHAEQLHDSGQFIHYRTDETYLSQTGKTTRTEREYQVDFELGELLRSVDTDPGEDGEGERRTYINSNGIHVNVTADNSAVKHYDPDAWMDAGVDYFDAKEASGIHDIEAVIDGSTFEATGNATVGGDPVTKYEADGIDALKSGADLPVAYTEAADYRAVVYVTPDGLVKKYHVYVVTVSDEGDEYAVQTISGAFVQGEDGVIDPPSWAVSED